MQISLTATLTAVMITVYVSKFQGGGCICKCEPGWKGFNCSVNVDDCKPNRCANGAACIDGLLDYDCICTSGWTGKTCNVGELIVFRFCTLSQKPEFPIKCNMML